MDSKIERARKLSAIGRRTVWEHMVNNMPEELLAQCTAKQIALIADLMDDRYQQGYDAGLLIGGDNGR